MKELDLGKIYSDENFVNFKEGKQEFPKGLVFFMGVGHGKFNLEAINLLSKGLLHLYFGTNNQSCRAVELGPELQSLDKNLNKELNELFDDFLKEIPSNQFLHYLALKKDQERNFTLLQFLENRINYLK